MKYFLSLQVVRPGARLGPLRRCLIVEGVNLTGAMDAMAVELTRLGLYFGKLIYASHCSGPEMDKVVLPIWRGLINDIDHLRTATHTKTVEVLACHYKEGEIEELLKMAIHIEEAIRDNSDNHR